MKKGIWYIGAVIISLIITFVLFELLSWYHFGDIPTKIVLIRLIACFCIITGILILIISRINKKQ